MEKESSKFRILVFPWLGYSHVIPYLELSKKLSSTNFQIYFCSSPINLDLIKSNLSNYPSIQPTQLEVPSLPQLPPKFHTTKNLPPNLLPTLIQAFQLSIPAFSKILDSIRPDLLIYDFFQPWAAKQALARGIPSVHFALSGAAPYSFFHHQFTYGDCSNFPYKEIYLLEHERVDVRKHVDAQENPIVKDADPGFAFGDFDLSCEIVLIRSLTSLEGKYIDYLSELCGKRVIPTGSLIPETRISQERGEILEWLNTKDEGSTVFICFGSDHFLSEHEIVEIAKGLDMCEVNFVWVIKFDDQGQGMALEDAMPEGFIDRVKERGLILTGWVAQAEILKHPSVGGFVSHCGWSSVLESLYYGVPVIAMPTRYDQPINGRLVAEAGGGLEVKKDGNGRLLGEEVGKAIGEAFGIKGPELKRGTRRVREMMNEEDSKDSKEVVKRLFLLCDKIGK